MKVLIRTDASNLIGSGHVIRCLTLGHYLQESGCDVAYACRELPGHLCDLIESHGFAVYRMEPPQEYQHSRQGSVDDYSAWLGVSAEQDAQETRAILARLGEQVDWIVLDHYSLDRSWEERLRSLCGYVAVIDDLANRPHDCDLVIDQNFYLDSLTRYNSLVSEGCRKLLGPQYAILRPEFIRARRRLTERDGKVSEILAFFGGFDSTGETVKFLQAVHQASRDEYTVNLVVGNSNARRDEIEQMASGMSNVKCMTNVTSMSEFMLTADFAFGAGGTTTWERCFLGLPTGTVEVADNQGKMLRDMASVGAVVHLGRAETVTAESYEQVLREVRGDPDRVMSISRTCLEIMGDNLLEQNCPMAYAMSQISNSAAIEKNK